MTNFKQIIESPEGLAELIKEVEEEAISADGSWGDYFYSNRNWLEWLNSEVNN